MDFSKADHLVQEWVDVGHYPGAGLWIVDQAGETLHERSWGGYTRETPVMIASAKLLPLVEQVLQAGAKPGS